MEGRILGDELVAQKARLERCFLAVHLPGAWSGPDDLTNPQAVPEKKVKSKVRSEILNAGISRKSQTKFSQGLKPKLCFHHHSLLPVLNLSIIL